VLVETLRLIFVMAAVLSANRLISAYPKLLGSLSSETAALVVTALAAASAYIVGGMFARLVERLLKGAEDRVARRHASELVATTVGLLIGAFVAAFVAWPFLVFVKPVYVGASVASIVALAIMTFTTRLAVRKRAELFGVLGVAPMPQGISGGGCLLDSSAAIDGRVLALFKAGLLPQPLCVPAFIIWEMQGIADSADPLRRRRGRRGLDMLASLREAGVNVRVLDEDPAATTDPDAKLVVVARRRGLPIVTSDSNLAKVAELQGVRVLNLHKLAELVRPPVLPGETISLRIVKAGRERGQGVGYLDDGTMVVVEGAARLIGDDLEVEVTSLLTMDTGRLLFGKVPAVAAEPKTEDDGPDETPTLREVR
jgi:uncharacterized protein YacL